MLKTKLFTGSTGGGLDGIFDYERFIKANQRIQIISINVFGHNYVLLTYRD